MQYLKKALTLGLVVLTGFFITGCRNPTHIDFDNSNIYIKDRDGIASASLLYENKSVPLIRYGTKEFETQDFGVSIRSESERKRNPRKVRSEVNLPKEKEYTIRTIDTKGNTTQKKHKRK